MGATSGMSTIQFLVAEAPTPATTCPVNVINRVREDSKSFKSTEFKVPQDYRDVWCAKLFFLTVTDDVAEVSISAMNPLF